MEQSSPDLESLSPTINSIDWLRSEAEVFLPSEKVRLEERGERLLNRFTDLYGQYIPEEKLERVAQKKLPNRIVVVDTVGLATIFPMFDRDEVPNGSLFSEIGVRYYARRTVESTSVNSLKYNNEESVNFYQSLVDEFGEDVHRFFFGQPISESTKVKILSKLTESALVEAVGETAEFYENNIRHEVRPEDFEYSGGVSFQEDDLILLTDQRRIFYKLSEDQQEEMTRALGDEERSRRLLEEAYMNESMIHEFIHFFEPPESVRQ